MGSARLHSRLSVVRNQALHAVRESLEASLGEPRSAALSWRPQSSIPLDEEKAETLFRLLEGLDDNDDVQRVAANFDVSDDVMAALNA